MNYMWCDTEMNEEFMGEYWGFQRQRNTEDSAL